MSFHQLCDVEAKFDGLQFGHRWDGFRPKTTQILLGHSSLARAIHALPFLEALRGQLQSTAISIEASPVVQSILHAHLGLIPADEQGVDFIVDLKPGIRRETRWHEGLQPVLRVNAVPYPHRRQHASDHWRDAALACGLEVESKPLNLRLPRQASREALRWIRDNTQGHTVVVLTPGDGGWSAKRYSRLYAVLNDRFRASVVSVHEDGSWNGEPHPPAVTAALLRHASLVIGDAGGWTAVASAVSAPVLTIHGRLEPSRHGPHSRLGEAICAHCKHPASHRVRNQHRERCLFCLDPDDVVKALEPLLARSLPRDVLIRCVPRWLL